MAGDAETLSYYLNCWQSLFSVQDAAGAVRLFRTEFLTVAGALTAVLFLGLSALGPLPIFLFAMLYGTGSGLLSSRLLVDLNPRTAFVLLCVCGIPASLAAGTLCTFGASALQVSGRLCSAAFGRGGQAPAQARFWVSLPGCCFCFCRFAVRQWGCCIWQGRRNLYELKREMSGQKNSRKPAS